MNQQKVVFIVFISQGNSETLRLMTYHPHGIFAAGRVLVLTQEKKRLMILGNIQKIPNLERIIA